MNSAADGADARRAPDSVGAGEQLGHVVFAFVKALLVGVVFGYLIAVLESTDPAYDPIPGDSGDGMAGLGIIIFGLLGFLFAGTSAFALFTGSLATRGSVHRWIAGILPLIVASPVVVYGVVASIVGFGESPALAALLLVATPAWASLLTLASFDILPARVATGGFALLALIAVGVRATVL